MKSAFVFLFVFVSGILNTSRCAVSFALESTNTQAITCTFTVLSTDSTMYFACGSSNDLSTMPTITALARSGKKINLNVTKEQSGWSGPSFLNWYSFSGILSGDTLKSGTLRIPFMMNASPATDIRITGNIIYLPLQKRLAKTAIPSFPVHPFSTGIRIPVQSDGIYQIDANMLSSLGLNLPAISSRSFRLFCKDIEIPILITNSHRQHMEHDDAILFFGKFLRGTTSYYTQYSNTNVYWLTWGGGAIGARLAEVPGSRRTNSTQYGSQFLSTKKADVFFDTLHIEFDNDIRSLGTVAAPLEMGTEPVTADTIDNWYWGFIGDNELTEYSFTLPSPVQNTSYRVRVGLRGLTNVENNPFDHDYSVLINGNSPAGITQRIRWDGQNDCVFISDVATAPLLIAGKNTITFKRESKGFEDRAALNWIDVEYKRNFTALNNQLWFKNNPGDAGSRVQFELKGFSSSNIDIWDIGTGRVFKDHIVSRTTTDNKALYSAQFEDSLGSSHTYYAQSSNLRISASVGAIASLNPSWNFSGGVDYVIITTNAFFPAMAPLVNLYRSRGLVVALFSIEDIYNQFSFGIKDPESIQNMLTWLYAVCGDRPPRYLLLGGDATHDLDKQRQERTIVPTHLSRVPGWGPSADDGYFALVNGSDNFADMFVGRLPAENSTQMTDMVNKIIAYQTHVQSGFWHDNLLLAGGLERDFTDFNNAMELDVIGQTINSIRMDADTGSRFYVSESNAAKTMSDYLNAGVYMLNFNGHGGGNVWSDSRFFSYSDLDRLYNGQWGGGGKLPFIFSFTCLTGFFESAFYRSLGEEFVRKSVNGAIAFYGASAYTTKQGNLEMNRILLQRALHDGPTTIGELITNTEMVMMVQNGYRSLPLIRQYNLLGDPATPFALAPDSLHLNIPRRSIVAGDTLIISATCSPVVTGQARIQIVADGVKWSEKIIPVTNGTFSYSFIPKDSSKAQKATIRSFVYDNAHEIRGVTEFSKDNLLVYNVQISNPRPRFGDSVMITCCLAVSDTLVPAEVFCLSNIGDPSNPTISYQGSIMDHVSATCFSTRQKIPLSFNGFSGDMLMVKFQAIYGSGSKESERFVYPIDGLPDLAFTTDSLRPYWQNDSLYIDVGIVNAGNAPAPPVSVVFLWGDGNTLDTMRSILLGDSTYFSKVRRFTISVPDTQGNISFCAQINLGHAFPEISFDNNTIYGRLNLHYRDIQFTHDTLFSSGGGLAITPQRELSTLYRCYLFESVLGNKPPLTTPSYWVPLIGDSTTSFWCGTRPALNNDENLIWTFTADTSKLIKQKAISNNRRSVFMFDSGLTSWRVSTSELNLNKISMATTKAGPFALADFSDNRKPDIMVTVNGRAVSFLDYAAKDKPFSVLISDPSGIVPSSISLQLNSHPISSDNRSSIPDHGIQTTVSITIYPTKERTIDTLRIQATDCAGNSADTTFTYLPGEELNIKFLSCHPNPFRASQGNANQAGQIVRLAYLLTDIASSATLSMYTITGIKIMTWNFSNIIGYQEVEWNGLSMTGNRLANGMYYLKLVAKNDRKTVSKIVRIAKLEGY